MKKTIKFLALSCALICASNSVNAQENVNDVLSGIKKQYAPDSRIAIYDLKATETDGQWYVELTAKDNEELNDFPIVGYKQNGKEGLTWSKDRQVTTNEEK